jgi:hypothetical protein
MPIPLFDSMRRSKFSASIWVRLLIGATAALLCQSLVLTMVPNDAGVELNLILQTTSLILFALWTWKIGASRLNPPLVFCACIYMWHSTFLTGRYFHLNPIFEFPGNAFTYGFEHIYDATALVGLSLGLSIVGIVLAYHRQRSRLTDRRGVSLPSSFSSLGPVTHRIAWMLLGTMILIATIYLAAEGAMAFSGGYMDAYYNASESIPYLLFYRSQFMWVFVIILLTASNRKNNRVLVVIGLITLCIATITTMLGSRSEPFICLAAFVVAFDCLVRRLPIWIVIVFLVALSAASYVIDNTRATGLGTHVFKFSESGKDKLDLWHFFYQNGLDIRAILRTMEFSQGDPPRYGESFLDAAFSVIPKPLLDKTGYEQPIQPSVWMIRHSPDVGFYNGMGYSLVAEMYYNFRMLGCLGFLLIGWFLGRTYFKYLFTGDVYAALNSMIVAVFLTLHMRSDSGVYLRLMIYSFLMVGLLKRVSIPTRNSRRWGYASWSRRVPAAATRTLSS